MKLLSTKDVLFAEGILGSSASTECHRGPDPKAHIYRQYHIPLFPMFNPEESKGCSRNQPSANCSQECSPNASSSPQLPPSSPQMSMPPAPPYPHDGLSLCRASIDSDFSIFPHFSLTPESEAGLRAWEQTMLGPMTPNPSKNPSSGTTQLTRCWVVFRGHIPGVYHSV